MLLSVSLSTERLLTARESKYVSVNIAPIVPGQWKYYTDLGQWSKNKWSGREFALNSSFQSLLSAVVPPLDCLKGVFWDFFSETWQNIIADVCGQMLS